MAISTTRKDQKTAQHNSDEIDDKLLGGGRVELPPGFIALARQISVPAGASGGQLVGAGRDRTLAGNLYDPSTRNSGLWICGDEIPVLAAATEKPSLGTLVYVNDGVDVIDGQTWEAIGGEYRTVTPWGWDRPLRRTYQHGYAPPVNPVRDFLAARLTIGQPCNSLASPLTMNRAYNCRLEDVGLGAPGETTQRSGLNASAYVRMVNVISAARIEVNTSHNTAIVGGCRLGGLHYEEYCLDNLVRDAVLAVNGQPWNGLDHGMASMGLAVENVTIEGAGTWYATGIYFYLSIIADDCRLRNVTATGTGAGVQGYFPVQIGGNRLLVEGLRTDAQAEVITGTGITLRDSGAFTWSLREGTGGRASNLTGPISVPVSPQVPGGAGWQIS